MSDKVPTIQPIKLKDYEVRQSKYEVVPKLPCISLILGTVMKVLFIKVGVLQY